MRRSATSTRVPMHPPFTDYGPFVDFDEKHEFKFTEAEKDEIRDKTFHAMSGTLDRIFPMVEEVLSKRKGREHE